MVETALMSGETVVNESEEGNSRGDVVVQHSNTKLEGRVEVGEQLLPGIPDEITLDLVATKLPWTSFHMLPSVSRSWQQAIQSRQVYESRDRAESRQTLLVMGDYLGQHEGELALYSLSDEAFYHLPPIQGRTGVVSPHQCVCLDGKLYVLGGYIQESVHESQLIAEVYMLDLLGQRRWKKCASMADPTHPRATFGSGVINGRIYVFGKIKPFNNHACEAYDPKSNTWSPIAHMKSLAIPRKAKLLEGKSSIEVTYNPVKDQWRELADHPIQGEEIGIQGEEILFMVRGIIYKLSLNSSTGTADFYYLTAKLWEHFCTTRFGDFGPENSLFYCLHAPLLVDDGLLVIGRWTLQDPAYEDSCTCFLRFKWFVGQEIGLLWHDFTMSMSTFDKNIMTPPFHFVCTVQL